MKAALMHAGTMKYAAAFYAVALTHFGVLQGQTTKSSKPNLEACSDMGPDRFLASSIKSTHSSLSVSMHPLTCAQVA